MHPYIHKIIIRTLKPMVSSWSDREDRVSRMSSRNLDSRRIIIIMTCGMHTEIIVARAGVRRTTPRPPYPNSSAASSKRRITSSVSGPAVAMWPLCYVPAPNVGSLGTGTAFQVHTLPSNFGVPTHHQQLRTFQTLPASYVINSRAYHGDLRINGGEFHRMNASEYRVNVRNVPFIPSVVYVSDITYFSFKFRSF